MLVKELLFSAKSLDRMEFLHLFLTLQLTLIGYQTIKLRNLKKSISKAQDKYFSLIKKNDIRIHEIYLSLEKWTTLRKHPEILQHAAFADRLKVIVSVKKLEIPSVEAPHNGSLVKTDDGYLLIFRFDTPLMNGSHISQVGSVQLTKDFDVLEDTFSKIKTGSLQSEDPRIFQNGSKSYLLFNEPDFSCQGARRLCFAQFDFESRCLQKKEFLSWPGKQTEKNWTPFSCENSIYFLYSISPLKVLKYSNGSKVVAEQMSSSLSYLQTVEWSKRWGELRGGTPAQLIDGEYLAFFHSSFEDPMGIKWYVMGAYTFEKTAPFRMTKMSSEPILFENIYETELFKTAHPGVRSIYPMGFVREKTADRDVIHLSCGENDSTIKIVTFDTSALFSTLKTC